MIQNLKTTLLLFSVILIILQIIGKIFDEIFCGFRDYLFDRAPWPWCVLVVSVQEYLSRRGPIGAKSKFSMYIDSYLCYNIIPVIFVERTIS